MTGLRFDKTIDILSLLGCSAPVPGRVKFTSRHIPGFSAIGRGDIGDSTWRSQRDHTQNLAMFEKLANAMTRTVISIPVHNFATLDDDLYCTRSTDNQMK